MLRTTIFIAALFFLYSCSHKKFTKLDGDKTGIHFANTITENDSINILNLEYVYNGGGVAIGDFNNDGLQDVFFTGNEVGNKLYLNQGHMHFKDVTEAAGIASKNRWNTGVAAVDINNDGLMDLYVCASIKKNGSERSNRLFINKGLNKDGIPVFEDQASAYNVADTGYSTNAAFFDYDNDGDLDLYVLTNKMAEGNNYPNQYHTKIIDGSSPTTDHLYRNDFDSALGHPVFTDVSRQAGIQIEGYGLGLNICDINQDGWKDVYVTNDFLTNDLLWINNGNGTFTDKAASCFKHTSYSAMGNDVTDINNDGLPDVISVDMLPATNLRKKMMTAANAYQTYMNNEAYHYEYQYGRNTLQINQGRVPGNDSSNLPVFSDVAFYAGVAETDWSWTPLVADFDNDGWRDIIITNGFPKDITDRDFMTYRVDATSVASKKEILEQIPNVKLHNYAFRNQGNLSFSDVSTDWGLSEPSFSNGAVYADLDNDGDLDMVINNINDEAFVYENNSSDDRSSHHYLQVQFKGDAPNINGIGSSAEIYYDHGKKQLYENSPYRGYLSTDQALAHFGLGTANQIDSLVIKWPNRKKQVFWNVQADQLIKAEMKNAQEPFSFDVAANRFTLFTDQTDSLKIPYVQKEIDFPDFNIQKLLPHKLSEYGPGMAVGDIDGNGLDDIVCGGSYSYSPTVLLQQPDGKFISKLILPDASNKTKQSEDMGLLLFDADGDGDLDLYIASGSYENAPNSPAYQDKFFLNDGKGNFSEDSLAIPKNLTSKSCVRAVDYDRDGDLDLFIAGRVEPWNYPKPVSSFIYRNDSKNGVVRFTDVTEQVAPALKNVGLVCDALWTDFDNDGWPDLLLAGEWMPMKILKNDKGIFKDITSSSGIDQQKGWWNSIAAGDFDNDGDIDYILGNAGQNSFYRVSQQYPARIYAKDFDDNGSYDAIPTLYLEDEQGNKKEFPAQTRDDLIKQMISMRAKFQTYHSFATASIDKLLSKDDLKGALVLEANNLQSSFMKNLGNGKFQITPLPVQAQLSTINGMSVSDFDGDGNLDLAVNTNDYGTEVSVGRYDALNGLFLKGDGKGNFSAMDMDQSGIFIPGNGKSLVSLTNPQHQVLLVAAQNRGPLKIFGLHFRRSVLPVASNDVAALVRFKNGMVQRQEFYYGSSFLSQSARYLLLDEAVQSVELIDNKGNKRKAFAK
ncbi:MAG: VCBS repeat-containing protein [Flavisolibacter sp.]